MKSIVLLLVFFAGSPFCFSQHIFRGLVTDEAGVPLVGVHISVEGAEVGTVTDTQGRFQLSYVYNPAQLRFRYTGYEGRVVEADAALSLTVALKEGILLNEAVITALGVRRQERSLGYATERIAGTAVSQVPQANFLGLLSGRTAGLMVQAPSGGNPGGSTRVSLRGTRSINGENQPLFVIDGIPMDNSNFSNFSQILANGQGTVYESQRDYGNAIQDLNPEDIEEIQILKGQAAAALYGSRGANGVLMVTTKQGSHQGKGFGIQVGSSITFDRVAVFPELQRLYGGGVALFPKGYADGSGHYKLPLVEFGPDGAIAGVFKSFDLVPIYAVDESSGTKFNISSDEHFSFLDGLVIGEKNYDRFVFPSGYGSNQQGLYFRDWNSWDDWDAAHFGRSRLWEVGDDPRDFFETGVSTRLHCAIDKQTDQSAFRLAYARFDQKGIYPNSHWGRHNFSLGGKHKLSEKLAVDVTANYAVGDNKGRSAVTYDFRGGFNPGQNFSQWWHTHLRFDDLKSFENPDGTMRTWNRQSEDNPRPQYWDNPYWSRSKNYSSDGRNRLFGHIATTYQINPWLQLTGRILHDGYSEIREERIAEGSLLQSQYTIDALNVRETNADLILRVDALSTDDFWIDYFIGGNKMWRSGDRSFGATIGGLNVPGIYRLQNSKSRPIISNNRAAKEIESLFLGSSIEWKKTLYLQLTGRNDWSSSLPDNSNSYFYPSASLSFIFTELKEIPGLSFGKLRLGWAQVGGDTDPYNVFSTYFGNPNFGDFPNYTVNNTLNNERLKPERTESVELGLDLRFFQNRLAVDLSLYSGTTTDQIIPLATSTASGYERQFVNAGKIRNRGVELNLTGTPFKGKQWEWEAAFHFGKNTNEVLSIIVDDASLDNLPLASPGAGISFNAFVGKPYGTILGSDFIYDEAGNKLIDPGTGYYLVSPGVVPIGNIVPDFTGGFSNIFRWKDLRVNALIDFRKGGDIFSITNTFGRIAGLLEETAANGIRENGYVFDGVLAEVDSDGKPILTQGAQTASLEDDRYKSNGTKNARAVSYDEYKFYGGGFYLNRQDLYDGSYIKLREVSLDYRLPERWLKAIGISELHVGAFARNLLIIHKNIPHIDPEISVSTANLYGNEGGAVPSTRSFGMSLNFHF